jgi:methionyl aminopeptidase
MSVNEQVVHGVPGTRRLVDGDILTIDCGALLDGWVADGAWTFAVGTISAEARELLQVTEQALYAAIAASRDGNQSGDVGAAMQKVVEAHGFNVIREHTSHGVGRELHEDPHIPNHGKAGTGLRLRTGMTIAMEPMVLAGHYATQLLDDEWTVAAKDGRLTAHFEHTIAIQDGDADILTRL